VSISYAAFFTAHVVKVEDPVCLWGGVRGEERKGRNQQTGESEIAVIDIKDITFGESEIAIKDITKGLGNTW
jgi:hypothetical protein